MIHVEAVSREPSPDNSTPHATDTVLPIIGGSDDPQAADLETSTILGLAIKPVNMMNNIPGETVDDTTSVDLGRCWIVDKLLSQWMPALPRNIEGLRFLEVTKEAMQDVQWGAPYKPS